MNSWSAAVNITWRRGACACCSALHLEDRLAEVVDALKILVDGGEADIGDIVHLLQLAHHHLADHAARDLALAEREDALLDPVDRLVHVLGRHRPLVQRAHEAGADLLAVVGNAGAVGLDHHGHRELDALVGGEALAAGLALAPPARAVAVLGLARVDHRGVLGLAERAFHRAVPARPRPRAARRRLPPRGKPGSGRKAPWPRLPRASAFFRPAGPRARRRSACPCARPRLRGTRAWSSRASPGGCRSSRWVFPGRSEWRSC